MVRFSPTDAVFGGFRFVKERPATILIWAAYLLLVLAVASVAMLDIGGDALTSLVLAAQAQSPDANNMVKLAEQVAPASLFAELLITVFGAVLCTAILRVRLTPGPHSWGGLRLGGDELRVLGGTLLVMVCIFSLSMATALVADLLAEVGVPPILTFLFGILLMLAVQVRLSLVGVICQAEGRISVIRSIHLTKGMFWRLAGAYVLLGALVLVILTLLMFIFAALGGAATMATGGGVNQMALALQGRFSDLNPLLAGVYILSNLAQVWVLVTFLAVFISTAVDAYKVGLVERG